MDANVIPDIDFLYSARSLAKECKVRKRYFPELAKVQLSGSRDGDMPFVTIEQAGTPELRAEWAAYVSDYSKRRINLEIAYTAHLLKCV